MSLGFVSVPAPHLAVYADLLAFADGFFAQHGSEIVTLTIEHLWLTGAAILFATAIGIPIGILLTRRARLAGPVLTVANIIQTIPSLALFGFLLPVPWLGDRAARIAIVALTGYALLPILRNTYIGIRSIDPAVIDVAQALGMTGSQRLFKVELPLAAGVILAGLCREALRHGAGRMKPPCIEQSKKSHLATPACLTGNVL
jgi:osmoprotectant transport system permease protein